MGGSSRPVSIILPLFPETVERAFITLAQIGRMVRERTASAFTHTNLCDITHKNMGFQTTMTYADFLEELTKAGLSVRAFAELVGMKPNSISNYARTGELPTHLALIAVLIVGISEMGGDYRRIMSRVPVMPKKPRGGARRGHFGGDRQTNLDLDS